MSVRPNIHNQADKAAERLQKRLHLSGTSGSGVRLSDEEVSDLLIVLAERERVRDRLQSLMDMEDEESRLLDALELTKKEAESSEQEDQDPQVPGHAEHQPQGVPECEPGRGTH